MRSQTLFAVHMTCESCVKSVSDSLYSLDGITNVDANLKDQLVAVEGTGECRCVWNHEIVYWKVVRN